jgi:cytidine deaminase
LKHFGMLEANRFTEEDIHCILSRTVSFQEHLDGFNQMLEFMVDQARAAAEKAESYRGFKVGCAVYACTGGKTRMHSRTRVFTGANSKPSPHAVKCCAERRAILAAQDMGYKEIVGMVIAGEPQADADSKIISPTLHPCLACRNFFTGTSGITANTQLLTIRLFEVAWERMTVGELIRLHRSR